MQAQLHALRGGAEGPALERAVAHLADLDEAGLLAYLLPVVRSGSEQDRRAALELVMALGSELARDFLLEAVLRTGCPDRTRVLQAAAQLDLPGSHLTLIRALEPERPLSQRVNAAFALGTLEASAVAPTLERLVRDLEEPPFLRRACLAALGQIPGHELQPLLLDLLADDDDSLSDSAAGLLERRAGDDPVVQAALAERAGRVSSGSTLDQLIQRHAARHRLDPALVASVIEVESNFEQQAVSRAGAQGLMQLMPETAKDMGVLDPFDPRQNIAGGTRYLGRMLQRFGKVDLALAAYNAGPTAVDRYRAIPPYPETQRYVRKVRAAYKKRTGRRLTTG